MSQPPSTLQEPRRLSGQLQNQGPDPDTYRLLATLEVDARALSARLDALLHQLQNELSDSSDSTQESIVVFHDVVEATCASVDAMVERTGVLVDRCEKLDRSLNLIHPLSHQIKGIKQALVALEAKVQVS
ncbi:hypothetical protein BJ684DRAFT_21415 [Piptocephalis cylindrospora]|uniref:BLOC-1-related complex subunit 6 C-terminal helix domain-containing protein n=1 Tax=Piptocephalis cylindrospora TaxID=1907219 RepID=A0A4P9XZT3_9FUNG|nr:hypothetical protein BJ684DRAFT_21415 [Piptocephalis cylindrospora]|eukprot:RKP12016.1 hypothetical protein BJ684DRAFT_21415 [Piptocephalis cylindrospora]